LLGTQVTPAAQLQLPLPSQELAPPLPVQDVPAVAFPVMAVHCDAPVEQSVFAVWHGLAGVHATPEAQLQWPAPSQELLLPVPVHCAPAPRFETFAVQA
jgi:hypothetical protein